MEKKMLMVATVPSMIRNCNMENIKKLEAMGYKVEIASNFMDRSVWDDNMVNDFMKELKTRSIVYYQVDFSREPKNLKMHYRSYIQILKLLQSTNYEFIHCHTPIAAAISRFAARRTENKVIYTAHGFHFYKGAGLVNWLFYYPIEKYLSKYTEVLITINKEDYERAKKSFRAKKVEYVPGIGIDVEKIAIIPNDKKKIRNELDIPDNAILLLAIGELNKNKNHELIIKSLAKINDKRIHLIICGKGYLEVHLNKIIREFNMQNQIKMLGYRKDIIEIGKSSDIFVFPSKREGLSAALMEAMACGLPVVCSDIRGNRDLIINEAGGYVLKNSVDNYVKAIKKLVESKNERMEYGRYNKTRVNNYSMDSVSRIMNDIYMSIDREKKNVTGCI